MTRGLCQRSGGWYRIPSFQIGLVTDRDYLVGDIRSARLMQNARCRTGRLIKRRGTRYYSPTLGSGLKARICGLHQWYPTTANDNNLVYAVSAGTIYRLRWDPTSAAPPTALATMAFDDAEGFGMSENAVFADYGDMCFAFNGVSGGAQMRLDNINSMWHFGMAKAAAPVLVGSATGGLLAAGTYKYAIRLVRERSERVRDWWGAISDTTSVTTTGATSSVTVTVPATAEGHVTHVYIYRTAANLNTLYYIGRVAIGTATYTDTALSAGTTIDEDVLDRDALCNPAFATVDDGSLFLVSRDTDTGQWMWFNSIDGRPQEFGIYNNDVISEGSGTVTGVHAYNGRVYVFREKGVIIYAKNSALTYDRVAYLPGWGNIAPWACRVIRDGKNNMVAFWDDSEGPSVITGDSITSLKRRRTGSDCVSYIDSAIDPAYRKYASVGYKHGYLYFSYTPIGSTYNTRCLVWDSAADVWYGPDTGYSMGPTFTRLSGYGYLGNGELLAAVDADTTYVMEMDANVNRDFTSYITLQVDSMAIASDRLPNETEYQSLCVYAKLSNIFKLTIAVPNVNYSQAYYIAPSQRYWMDDGSLFDGGATMDEACQSLFDSAVFDRATDVFDTMRDMPYTIELDSCAAQGSFATVSLYDALGYEFEISSMQILTIDRGER